MITRRLNSFRNISMDMDELAALEAKWKAIFSQWDTIEKDSVWCPLIDVMFSHVIALCYDDNYNYDDCYCLGISFVSQKIYLLAPTIITVVRLL